jgi:AhpD family alkylhydroperoxidase
MDVSFSATISDQPALNRENMSFATQSTNTPACTESAVTRNRSNNADASIELVQESDASGKIEEIYNDIKKTLGIDFVPNMYKAMAKNPAYLEFSWRRIRDVMGQEGKLGRKTKDIVALTVCIMSGCEYCIQVYNSAVKHLGLDDEALLELYSVIDVYSGLNRLNVGLQLRQDEKPWNGCGAQSEVTPPHHATRPAQKAAQVR